MLCVRQAIRQFWKRLALTVAVNDGHDEHLNNAQCIAMITVQWSRLIVSETV